MEYKAVAGGPGGEVEVIPSENDGVVAPEVNRHVVRESPAVKKGDLFGPWMMVCNRGRKSRVVTDVSAKKGNESILIRGND
ncbi:hypothetical protein CDL15_Pgr005138 [Punica granatum]|uniref:Uncharacterized protein n=1 Tax=Punica granatum TaxID=22663 RepID=A0A218WQ03_PUNGR|nr:hypothetical protein CDL15_Pgr005138 [Punica granatum]